MRHAVASLATATLTAGLLAACGPRMARLEPARIAQLAIVPPGGRAAICANDSAVPLRAIVIYRDGTRLATSEAPGEHLDALVKQGELSWATSRGAIDPHAMLFLPSDRLSWFGEPVVVRTSVVSQPTMQQSLSLSPRYDCGATATRGLDGAHGSIAEPGETGGNGRHVQVALTYVDLPSGRMALARVSADDGEEIRYYVIDPKAAAGSFTIDARGGDGGRGGQGSAGTGGSDGRDGRDGYDGSNGSYCTSGGNGESGDRGGDGSDGDNGAGGGDGGDGGTISVEYDQRFPELVRLLGYAVDGGEGGEGGIGGRGGSGGDGGDGGRGGKGGHGAAESTGNGTSTPACDASDGSDGSDGFDGSDGRDGAMGPPGRHGRPGEVHARAVDVAALFAAERARALPIAADPPAAPTADAAGQ
jgi:hypothetical protein